MNTKRSLLLVGVGLAEYATFAQEKVPPPMKPEPQSLPLNTSKNNRTQIISSFGCDLSFDGQGPEMLL